MTDDDVKFEIEELYSGRWLVCVTGKYGSTTIRNHDKQKALQQAIGTYRQMKEALTE